MNIILSDESITKICQSIIEKNDEGITKYVSQKTYDAIREIVSNYLETAEFKNRIISITPEIAEEIIKTEISIQLKNIIKIEIKKAIADGSINKIICDVMKKI